MKNRKPILAAVCFAAVASPIAGCRGEAAQEEGVRVETVTEQVPLPSSGSDLAPSTPGFAFRSSEGQEPVSLVVEPGKRLQAVFLDTAATALPPAAAQERARGVARELWEQVGSAQRTDTVSVAFTNRVDISPDRVMHEFFFYSSDLAGP